MKYKIVADSSCDLTSELKENMGVGLVPLTIEVDNKTFIDDENIKVNELIWSMKQSKTGFKTACPSPAQFMNEYEKAENIFVVTLSSALSGTYNSAMMAKEIMLESVGDKFIHVFDSLSASVAETLVSMKIYDLIQSNHDKYEIITKVENYIKEMKTFFILDSLDNLIKTGRINKFAGQIATALNIKPIMGADDDGSIKVVEKIRGSKKAFKRLAQVIGEQGNKFEDKIIAISHCNALEKAEALKNDIKEMYNFKDILIVEMAGLSTAYANEGGIIVAF